MTEKILAVHNRLVTLILACTIILSFAGSAGVGARSPNAVTVDSVTIQTAPRSSFDHLDASNISTFATKDDEIAVGDVLIFRLSTSGVSESFDGEITERRFLELVQSDVIGFQIRQTGVTRAAKTFNIPATIENGGIEVFHEGNTMYIAIDTGRAVFDQGGTTVGIEPGERFNATFTGHGSNGTGVVASEFRIVPRMATFDTQDNGTVVVEAAANQTVTGETTVAPGTDLTIRIHSKGQSSFILTQTVQVGEHNEFETDFDTTNVTRGISFKLTIPNQGFENNASTPGIVRRPPTASIRVNPQGSRDGRVQTVTIRSGTLSDGGFLAIYDSSVLAGDNVTAAKENLRGVSGYISPGKHSTVNITLDRPYTRNSTIIVIPHQDTNDNREYDFITNNGSKDVPYLGADGDPIVVSANVTVNHTPSDTTVTRSSAESDNTPTPQTMGLDTTMTATSGANQTESTATSNSSGNTTSGSGTGSDTAVSQQPTQEMTTDVLGPGFGFVLGLVALGVVVLLAIQHEN